MPLLSSLVDDSFLIPHSQKISRLYSVIDAAYTAAARHYGFDCRGCADSCCAERFYHYTISEHIFLATGVISLDPEDKKWIFGRADEVTEHQHLHDAPGHAERAMCPLNREGLCLLYAYRPMICRLQGIPHYLKKAGQPQQRGPGCHVFDENIGREKSADFGFDHTPFYSEMAALEIEIRNRLQYRGRSRKTVAEMLVDIRDAGRSGGQ
jgi:hypothetical protein